MNSRKPPIVVCDWHCLVLLFFFHAYRITTLPYFSFCDWRSRGSFLDPAYFLHTPAFILWSFPLLCLSFSLQFVVISTEQLFIQKGLRCSHYLLRSEGFLPPSLLKIGNNQCSCKYAYWIVSHFSLLPRLTYPHVAEVDSIAPRRSAERFFPRD